MEQNNMQEEKNINLPEEQDSSAFVIGGAVLLSGIIIAGSILYLGKMLSGGVKQPTPAPSGAVAAAPTGDTTKVLALGNRDVILGSPNAKVTIIEYADYQCPFCHRFFTQTFPQIKANYIDTGKAKFVFRNFAFLGPESTLAASAAECSKDQNKFFDYHDALMKAEIADGQENSGNITRDFVVNIARTVGLDVSAFSSCVDSKKYDKVVADTKAAASSIGVNATPMTFVNGTLVQGAQPFAAFQATIDKAISS